MQLINKSRGTGKTTQLIYASAITGFRIIAPNHNTAKHIEKMAKDMGIKILPPMSDVEYRNRKELWNDHRPILIDEIQDQILDEALELYFDAPVVAATMTVPIDEGCFPPTPKPKVITKTNRDVFNETFGYLTLKLNKPIHHLEDALAIQTEDGEYLKFEDWLDRDYVEPKKEQRNDKDN